MGIVTSERARYRERALRCLDQLPPFSPIIGRVLATMANEDVSFGALAELIEKDAVLAGNVLRLVNSAAYGRSGTINSVRHAVSLVGLGKLRNLVLGMQISRLWSRARLPASWCVADFNLHSVSTAVLADLLAQRLRVTYPEGAFAAGLLHDLGKLVIAIALLGEYQAIERLFALGGATMEECEMEILGMTHAQLSAAALAQWNLPGPIVTAVAHHHSGAIASKGAVELGDLVQAADKAANQFGYLISPTTAEASGDPRESFSTLGLADGAAPVLHEFQSEFETIRTCF